MRDKLAGELKTILDADVQALLLWTRDQEAIARSLARSPALRPLVRELVTASERPDGRRALSSSSALADVRSLLRPALENFGYTDFFVISPPGQIVATRNDAAMKSVVDGYRREFFEKVLKGPASVSKPFRSPTLLPDTHGEMKAGLPTMLVAAAVPDEEGRPLGALALSMRPRPIHKHPSNRTVW